VIPIPSQDHGESFTQCRLQNHTDFAGLIYVPYSACVLFDPGGDVATLPTCDIENVGVQTADDHLLVSRDSETTTDEEISHICPSLIHFVVTLEQQFITIDDLLTEEAVDPFTDNAMAKDVIAACIQLDTSLLFDLMIAHHLTLEPIVFDINMMIEPHIDPLQCIDNNEVFCATMGRDTDAADGDNSAVRPTIPRALIEFMLTFPTFKTLTIQAHLCRW
jgi:hypothetical protein